MDFKALRGKYKWSQMRAAKEVGVALFSWQRWENSGDMPNEKNMKKIKEVFKDGVKENE